MAVKWEAENMRVSLFSNEPISVEDQDWQAIAGQSENYNRQTVPGGHIYGGAFEGTQLNLSGVGRRIDLVQSVLLSPSNPIASLPTIGSWETARDNFVGLTSTWLGAIRFPIVRIAFGAVLLSPAYDRRACYEALKALLSSVSVDPDEMRELSFRVNWVTKSRAVDGLQINRITGWAALEVLFANLEVGTTTRATPTSRLHAVRLEIDHSTSEERSEPLEPRQVKAIYNELVSAASENALKGERP
jgi:hypothetical protein